VKQPVIQSQSEETHRKLNRSLGLFDSTMIVAGSMIGSGIFIVAAEMAREVGSAGWLMVAWLIAGILTMTAALSYGELAAMMPHAGGQYVYLREAFSPLWGFLYGWTLFLVIQTGTIAASSVGFARYLGVLCPQITEVRYIVPPIHILPTYAISLSTAQLVSLLLIAFLTWTNTSGLKYGKGVQNVFTTMKIGSLIGVILIGLLIGWKASVVSSNFGHAWTPRGFTLPAPGISPVTGFGTRSVRHRLARSSLPMHGTTSPSVLAKYAIPVATYRSRSPLAPSLSWFSTWARTSPTQLSYPSARFNTLRPTESRPWYSRRSFPALAPLLSL
jgi:APA family basic amino acid/polyamine antiporter